MDFGRITLDQDLILYLSVPPARTASGSCGTTSYAAPSARRPRRHLAASPTASPPSTTSRTAASPFVIALNGFDGSPALHPPTRSAKPSRSAPTPPIITTDARHRADAKSALITLVEHALMASAAGKHAAHVREGPRTLPVPRGPRVRGRAPAVPGTRGCRWCTWWPRRRAVRGGRRRCAGSRGGTRGRGGQVPCGGGGTGGGARWERRRRWPGRCPVAGRLGGPLGGPGGRAPARTGPRDM